MTKLKVGMISLGCNKNRVDSETALGLLREHGYELTNDPAQADVLMVNTCGFIASAKEESIDAILDMARYKQIGKCRVLVVTGCLAQRYEKDLMQEIPEIDLLMGVNQYQQLPDALEKALGGVRKSYCMDDHTYYAHDRVLTTPSYTAYTRIGEGCSNCCTFCAIPKIRGPYRSRPEADILREIESLAKQGVKEHILVAQDTSRYGMDFGGGSKLAELMQKAAKIDGVDWLRVLYCYPEETSEQLLDIIANTPNICSYVDLPIQHVNDAVLKRMHRRGTSAIFAAPSRARTSAASLCARRLSSASPARRKSSSKNCLISCPKPSSTASARSPTPPKRARPLRKCPTKFRRKSRRSGSTG